MESIKRIEIITDALQTREVCRMLSELGVTGYSIFRDVTGYGERGTQSGDELTDVFKNSMVLTTCTLQQLPKVVAAIRPILQRRGGICLVSDAQSVLH